MEEKEKYMMLALKEAKKAYEKAEVPVGAIIVKDGKVIARAHNEREEKESLFGHAEILAIKKACKKLNSWRLDGAEIYVTLEPCLMCVGAISQSRISKVYIGAMDYKNGCVGSKFNALNIKLTHKTEYEYGVLQNECSSILSEFFKELREYKNNIKSEK